MDKIDYKKCNRELYAPNSEPSIITVPAMKFILVDGCGNPNDPDGEYIKAVELLYALTFAIKMGLKLGKIRSDQEVFPDYVAPPLEGYWWLNDKNDMDFTQKDKYCWISMIRQPDFITKELFLIAQAEVIKKKPELDVDKARFELLEEGLCVQCMHIGSYDAEPATIKKIEHYIEANGLIVDFQAKLSDGSIRRHHEIYLSDPRKTVPAKMKTILRHPVRYQ
jgi:hypothetical protein